MVKKFTFIRLLSQRETRDL